MSEPKHSPLPWRNELDGSDYGHMRDANGDVVEIYGDHGNELRALIVTAVNSHAELLAAAKGAMQFVFKREILADEARAYLALQAAIARAEEQAS